MSRSRGNSGPVRRLVTAGNVGRTILIGSVCAGFAGIVTAALLAFNVGTASADPTVVCSVVGTTLQVNVSAGTSSFTTLPATGIDVTADATKIYVNFQDAAGPGTCATGTTYGGGLVKTVEVLTSGTAGAQAVIFDDSSGVFASGTSCGIALDAFLPTGASNAVEVVADNAAATRGLTDDQTVQPTPSGLVLSVGACGSGDSKTDVNLSNVPNVIVQGENPSGANNILDLTQDTTTQLTVAGNGNNTASPGTVTNFPTSSGGWFSGLTTLNFQSENEIKGAGGTVGTIFQPDLGASAGITFLGTSNSPNVLDLSTQSALLTVAMNTDSAAHPVTVVNDKFDNIKTINGSPGGTTFQPGNAAGSGSTTAWGVTFNGSAAATGPNTIDLTSEAANTTFTSSPGLASQFTAAMNATTLSSPPQTCAAGAGELVGLEASGTTVGDCFTHVSEVDGAYPIQTIFEPNPALASSPGPTFNGECPSPSTCSTGTAIGSSVLQLAGFTPGTGTGQVSGLTVAMNSNSTGGGNEAQITATTPAGVNFASFFNVDEVISTSVPAAFQPESSTGVVFVGATGADGSLDLCAASSGGTCQDTSASIAVMNDDNTTGTTIHFSAQCQSTTLYTLTCAPNPSGVAVGMTVSGTGVPNGTLITSIGGGGSFGVSTPFTVSSNELMKFAAPGSAEVGTVATGCTTFGSTTATVTCNSVPSAVASGMTVSGPGVPTSDTVSGSPTSTTVTLTSAATISTPEELTFTQTGTIFDTFANVSSVVGSSGGTVLQPGNASAFSTIFSGSSSAPTTNPNTIDLTPEVNNNTFSTTHAPTAFTAAMNSTTLSSPPQACSGVGELVASASGGPFGDCFSHVSVILGASYGDGTNAIPTTFEPDPAVTSSQSVSYDAQCPCPTLTSPLPTGSIVSLNGYLSSGSGAVSGLTVAMNGNTFASPAQITATTASGKVLYASFYGAQQVASPAIAATFRPDQSSAVTFVGAPSAANTVDLCAISAGTCQNSAFAVAAMNQNSSAGLGTTTSLNSLATGCTSASGVVSCTSAPSPVFVGMTVSNTPAAPVTTPVPSGTVVISASPLTISGSLTIGSAEALSFGGTTPSATAVDNVDFYENVTQVTGSGGGTVFQPGSATTASGTTFLGTSGVVNTLDLCSPTPVICANSASYTIAMNSDTPTGLGTLTSPSPAVSDSFANVTNVEGSGGSSAVKDDFQPGTAQGITFTGGSGTPSNTLNLTNENSGFTSFQVNMQQTSTCSGSGQGEVTSIGSAGNVADCFSGIGTVKGAAVQTTLQPGTSSVNFAGQSATSNTIDLSLEPSASIGSLQAAELITSAPSVAGCGTASVGELVGLSPGGSPTIVFTDFFCNAATIIGGPSGAPSIPTTFYPGQTSGETLLGQTGSDVLSLAAASVLSDGHAVAHFQSPTFTSFTVTMNSASAQCTNEGLLASTGQTILADCFTGIGTVLGPNVSTTFRPSTGNVAFVGGTGTSVNNTLDLTAETANNLKSLQVKMNAAPTSQAGCTSTVGQLTGVPVSTEGVSDNFCNISTVDGATGVATTFQPDPTLTGSTAAPTFVGNDVNPGGSVLDVSHFTTSTGSPVSNLLVNLGGDTASSQGEVSATVGTTPTTVPFAFFYGVDEEFGTFAPNPAVAAALQIPASSQTTFVVEVNGDSSSSPGDVLGGGFANTFYGITTLDGNTAQGGTTFVAGTVLNGPNVVPIGYYGAGQGTNTLSFKTISLGTGSSTPGLALTIDAANNVATVPTGGFCSSGPCTVATFQAIAVFDGCVASSVNGSSCSATTFDPPLLGNTTFNGHGSGNTINFASLHAPTSVLETNGSGNATPNIIFNDVQTFYGSGGPDTFTIGANVGTETFNGGGGAVTANFSSDSGVTVTLSPPSPNTVSGTETANVSGGAGNLILNNFTTFIGSSSGGNTFNSDGYGGHLFEASGSNNVLNYSSALTAISVVDDGTCSTSTLPNCVNGLSSNTVLGSSTTDGIAGITTFKGATGGSTFQSSGSVNGVQFLGASAALANNVLKLTNAPGGGTTITDRGTATGTATFANGNTNPFSNISQFVGSANGSTTFDPAVSGSVLNPALTCTNVVSGSAVTFMGLGEASSNTIVLSSLDTSSNPATVNAPFLVTPSGQPPNSVCLGGNALETFSGIGIIDGPPTGNTTFNTQQTGGFAFHGEGAGNTLSYDGVASGGSAPGVTVNFATNQVSCTGGIDTFSGISTVVGTHNNDLFEAGPTQVTINGDGGNDTLTFAGASQPIDLTMAAGTATVTGGFGPTITASQITTFDTPNVDGNSFLTDGTGGTAGAVNFDAPGGSTGNTLSLANSSGAAIVNVTSASGLGKVTGLTSVINFADIQNYTGNGNASEELSFKKVPVGVTFQLASAQPAVTSTTGNSIPGDLISGFNIFEGAGIGNNVFVAPASSQPGGLGGLTFTGNGPNNTLDLSQAPSGTTVDQANSLVDIGGGGTDSFSGIQNFVGSQQGGTSTNFSINCNGGANFTGSGSSATITFASPGCSAGAVVINAVTGTIMLPDGSDTFSGIVNFNGPSTGSTTFVLPATGKFSFTGGNAGGAGLNTLDASALSAGARIDNHNPASGTVGTTTFSNVTCFVGSKSGGTTLVTAPVPTAVSTIDGSTGCDDPNAVQPQPLFEGQGTGNALDLSNVAAGASSTAPGVTLTAGSTALTPQTSFNASEVGDTVSGTGIASGTTLVENGVSFLLSLPAQSTEAAETVTLQPNIGVCMAAVAPCSTVATNPPPGGGQLQVAGTAADNFVGVSSFTGPSTGKTMFVAADGPGQSFTGGGLPSTNYLSVLAAGRATTVNATAGVVDLDGGTTNTILFSNIANFVGSHAGATNFEHPARAGFTFAGNGTGNTLDLTQTTSNTTVDLARSLVDFTSGVDSGALDSFSDAQIFDGSAQAVTSYNILCAGGYTLGGSGLSTITFAPPGCAAGQLVINAVTGTMALPAGGDTFSGVVHFNGPSTGSTTFVLPASGTYTFNGGNAAGAGLNTLDASALPAGITIDDHNGLSGGTAGTASQDAFSNVTCFVGSTSGSTTMVAASTTTPVSTTINASTGCDDPNNAAHVLFEGQGTGNILSLSKLSAGAATSASSVTLTVGSTALTPQSSFSVAEVGDTISGAGIGLGTTIVRTSGGSFVLSQAAQSTETTPESVALQPNIAVCMAAAIPCSGVGANLPVGSGQLQIGATGTTITPVDNFAGVASVIGSSSGNNLFVAADAPGQRFTGGGRQSTNYLSLLAAGKGTTVTTTPSVVDLDGATTSTIAFSVIGNFVGSASGSTTFRPDASTSFTFTGWQSSSPGWQGTPGAISGNVLDLSNAPAGTNVTVAATGNVTLGSAASDVFSGISTFKGSTSGSTQFLAPQVSPAGGITFTGQGPSNSLSFANLQSVVPAPGAAPQSITGKNFTIDLSGQTAGVPTLVTIPSATVIGGRDTLTCTNSGTAPCAPSNAVGSNVTGKTGIPIGTTILFSNKTSNGYVLTMSQNATASATEAVTLTGTLPVATYSDIQTITGAVASDTFKDGAANNTIIDPSGNADTLSYANAPAAGSVNLITGSATGGLGGKLTLINEVPNKGGIQSVISSPRGMTIVGNNRSSTFTEGTGSNTFTVSGDPASPSSWTTTFNTPSGAPVGNNKIIFNATNGQAISDGASAPFSLGLSAQTIPGFGQIVFSGNAQAQTLLGGNSGDRLAGGNYPTTLISGAGTNNVLFAGSAATTLEGGAGPATIIGGPGLDTMIGGRGSDIFIPGTGGGSITDTQGTGTLDEARATGTVLANLGTSTFTVPVLPTAFAFPGLATKVFPNPYPAHVGGGEAIPAGQVTVLTSAGHSGKAYTLTGLVNIDGSKKGDVIVGSDKANVIVAGPGTNIVAGGGGNDNIRVCANTESVAACGTAFGTNTFLTGSGSSTVRGSSGSDNWIDYATASSGVSVNLLTNSAKNGFGGSDSLININNVIGSANADVIKLGNHSGTIFAGGGSGDDLTGSKAGNDLIAGGDGGDTFTIQGNNDILRGGTGSDSFFTNTGPGNGYFTRINGGSGFNTAFVSCTDVLFVPPKGSPPAWANIEQLFKPSVCKKGAAPSHSMTKTLITPAKHHGGTSSRSKGKRTTPATKPSTVKTKPTTSTAPASKPASRPTTSTAHPTTATRTSPAPATSGSAGAQVSRERARVFRAQRE